ncbi:Protein Diedel [Lasiodiplodia theobromae]|uniref:Protein Diedel n=1 Tax=Lasiodiplodia theobromae TaxID=45133 RepID=A0A5N5CUJ9_9PEZI|nr:Protein Diedel [Lasiodiplodia theobromae]
MHISTLMTILSTVAPIVVAECCGAGFCHKTTPNCFTPNACADGAWATPCCGRGKCNIFCCACDGGCHNPKLAKRLNIKGMERRTAELTDTEAFGQANVDGTGNLTLNQYIQYMGATNDDEVYVSWFNKHDKNGDGIITADEVRLE